MVDDCWTAADELPADSRFGCSLVGKFPTDANHGLRRVLAEDECIRASPTEIEGVIQTAACLCREMASWHIRDVSKTFRFFTLSFLMGNLKRM